MPIGDAFVLPTPDCTRHRNAHAHKCIKVCEKEKRLCLSQYECDTNGEIGYVEIEWERRK